MSALDELRENLREAARRDIEAKRVRRRRQRRATGLIALALIGGSAVATAADLISVGEPAVDVRDIKADGYRPQPGALRLQILARADADDLLPIGLGSYKAKNGLTCLVVGSMRGYTLGQVEGSVFKPYPPSRVGSCFRPGHPVYDTMHYRGRTLLFGAMAPGITGVTAVVDGERHPGKLQQGNTFVFVFRGKLGRSKLAAVAGE